MKRGAIISLALMAALAVSGEVLPSQPVSPTLGTGEVEEPALPAPEADPTNPGPGLLPETGELPSRPPAKASAKLSSTRTPAQLALNEEGRFDVVRSLAMKNRHAAYLLNRARRSSNSASRRTYLRAYYVTVASRMRKLDPKLKSSINAYEESKLHELSGAGPSTERGSTRRSRLRRIARLAGHHRPRRVSYQNRYRIIVIDAPYGPVFPPDGPPVAFEPW